MTDTLRSEKGRQSLGRQDGIIGFDGTGFSVALDDIAFLVDEVASFLPQRRLILPVYLLLHLRVCHNVRLLRLSDWILLLHALLPIGDLALVVIDIHELSVGHCTLSLLLLRLALLRILLLRPFLRLAACLRIHRILRLHL